MKTKIERAIKKTIENKELLTIDNIVVNSLFFTGGTVSEFEVSEYLKENCFNFKNGFYMFIESEDIVFINYSNPIKIVKDYTWTHKFTKSKVKAVNGLQGLREHIKENSKIEDIFFFSLNSLIKDYEFKYNISNVEL